MTFTKGDYVLATKYDDGDTGDHYVVGFYDSQFDHFGQTRYMVVDSDGKNYRGNGFRRCEKITPEEGTALVALFPLPMTTWVETGDPDNPTRPEGTAWDWLAKVRSNNTAPVVTANEPET